MSHNGNVIDELMQAVDKVWKSYEGDQGDEQEWSDSDTAAEMYSSMGFRP